MSGSAEREGEPVVLEADPGHLQVDLGRAALMVIDVQNAFLSEGGFFTLPPPRDTLGETVTDPSLRLHNMREIIAAARTRGLRVIYTLSVNPPSHIAGPDSPYWQKTKSAIMAVKHPEWRDKLLIGGTWGAEIIEMLAPEEGDVLVEKPRYSAFFQTSLDTTLRSHHIKYLFFIGVATNICVEATIRDAYYNEYFPIIVRDATVNSGPPFTQEATLFNVKACYGWVASTEQLRKCLGQTSAPEESDNPGDQPKVGDQ
jgi:ureidoacrylate peracid hydrolase